jgi:glycerate kinase
MRVLIAPDCFGGVLDAAEAARAIAAGWLDAAPGDRLDLAPLSDGGPGFLGAMQTALGGELVRAYVADPRERQVPATLLLAGDTAWVESAEACGLHLLADTERDPRRGTTRGVGELILIAAGRGARRCVVGLGGSGTNDGGAGAWAALGAEPADRLTAGAAGLTGLTELKEPRLPGDIELLAATDVDNPLCGPAGASAVFGPQKGADRATVLDLDDALARWADLVEEVTGRPALRDAAGAGAAGGLGFGLLALGAQRVPGAQTVIDAVGLAERVAGADLVVTGEGRFDAQSLRGKVASAVARHAQAAGVPCVVVAGQVTVGEREMAAWGVDAAYAVTDIAGSVAAAIGSGPVGVQAAARLAARDWSRSAAPGGTS